MWHWNHTHCHYTSSKWPTRYGIVRNIPDICVFLGYCFLLLVDSCPPFGTVYCLKRNEIVLLKIVCMARELTGKGVFDSCIVNAIINCICRAEWNVIRSGASRWNTCVTDLYLTFCDVSYLFLNSNVTSFFSL